MPRSNPRASAARTRKAGLPGRRLALVSLILLALGSLAAGLAPLTSRVAGQSKDAPQDASAGRARSRLAEAYERLPLSFEANVGQAEGHVKYLSRGDGYTLSLSATEATLSLRERAPRPPRPARLERLERADAAKEKEDAPAAEPLSATLTMRLLGANPRAEIVGEGELPGKTNYIVGADAKDWRAGVANFARVRYEEVYPGVRLLYHGDGGRLEYDFVVEPGADPKLIRLGFRGAERIEIDPASGELVLHTRAGELRQSKPFTYQEVGGERREVASAYVINPGGEVGFEVAEYDHSLPLVIDPVIVYSTLLDFTAPSTGGVAVDAAGNVYLTGQRNGGVYVAKINAAGTAFVFQTYVGGPGQGGALGTDIAVDAAGNIYVGGDAWALDMPVVNAFQPTKKSNAVNVSDAYVFKLAPNGSTLVYATYLGGYDRDDCYALAIDAAGNAYVAGYTESPVAYANAESGAPFPTVNAYQPNIAGDNDAFLTKFDPRGRVVYSTYLGGLTEDIALDVAVDAEGAAYLTGVTDSDDFPTANAYQTSRLGNGDLFVTKFNPQGTGLVYSTYLGGAFEEIGWGLALDSAKNVYLTGYTYGGFPVKNALQGASGGFRDAFVTKLNSSGSDLVYSTYLGGSDGDGANDIFVDAAGAAYVVGDTFSTNFPVRNAVRPTGGEGSDAFLTKLDPAGASIVHSTFIGGGEPAGIGADYGSAVVADAAGNAYVLGRTYSGNFAPLVKPLQAAGQTFLLKLNPERDETFYRIQGVVRDGYGNSIPGATVTLGGSQQQTTTTNESGGYAFNGARAGGNYTVTPSMKGRAFTPQSQSFNALSADARADFDVVQDAYYIQGRVVGADGLPLSGVAVELTGTQTRTGFVTDASGNYSFGSLPRGGTYTVTPSKAGYAFTPRSQTFADLLGNKTANFSGAPTEGTPTAYAIGGRVTSAGAPMAGVTLTVTGSKSATATTDATGAYSLKSLPAGGSYTVRASKPNYMFDPGGVYVDNLDGDKTANFAATLVSYQIAGRVAAAGGAGLAGVAVALSGSDSGTAMTDANGAYSFILEAEGNYTLTPSKAGYTFTPAGQTFNGLGGNQTANFAAAASPTPTPTPAPTPTPNPTPTPAPSTGRVNYALSSNGATATASSQYSSQFPVAAAINGDRQNLQAGAVYNMWHGATTAKPDWLEVSFGGARTIDEINVFTQRDDFESGVAPTEADTFTKYGVRDFEVQYWDGSAWYTAPGCQVSGNSSVWRKFTFAPLTTTRLRLVVTATADGYSRVWELEAWGSAAGQPQPTPTPTPTTGRANFALSSNGASALASSQYSASFPAAAAINGDRHTLRAGSGYNMWHGATTAKPDWLEVTFAGAKTIDEVSVFGQRDDFETLAEATEQTTFTKYGLRDFVIQYWTGSSWAAVPGAQAVGNDRVWRKFTFAPVTTTKLRLVVTATADGFSRVWELEAWGVDAAPAPVGRTNVALAGNGGVASASSQLNSQFPASAVIDGDRRSLRMWDGRYNIWHGASTAKPDWVEVTFGGPKTISEVGVVTQQDDYNNPVEPSEATAFTKYGPTEFDVQFWDGSQWLTVPGGAIVGNDRVWRRVQFSPVTTTKVRVLVKATKDGYSRVMEVEAWTP